MLKVSLVMLCCAVAINAQYNSYLPPTAGGYSYAQGSVLPGRLNIAGQYGSGRAYGSARSLSSLYRPAPSQFATSSYQSAGSLSAGYGAGAAAGGASTQYGAPGGYNAGYGRYTSTEDPLAEPANYDFSYEVVAPEYGVQFGHQESRRDEQTTGHYNVLLPDGRTQIVQYEADQGGYRPTITYQEPAGGYGRGSGGYGNGGYAQGGAGYAAGNGGAAGYAAGGAGGYASAAGGYAQGGYGNGGSAQGGARYAAGNGGPARYAAGGAGGYAAGGYAAGSRFGGAYAGGAGGKNGGAAGRNGY